MAGPDRILYASDFPHEPTEEDLTGDVPEFLEREEFDDDVKAKILYRNAKRLYGIA
jgi:predicted TIM-barrel fold metal-dependent hydrolase